MRRPDDRARTADKLVEGADKKGSLDMARSDVSVSPAVRRGRRGNRSRGTDTSDTKQSGVTLSELRPRLAHLEAVYDPVRPPCSKSAWSEVT